MKKNNLFLLSVLCIFLVSCNKEEDKSGIEETATAVALSGTWLLQSYSEDGLDVPLDECEKKETIVFNNNNTIDFNYYNDKEDGKACSLSVAGSGHWKFSSDAQIELDYSTESYKDIFKVTYQIAGNILTLTTQEGDASYSETYVRQ